MKWDQGIDPLLMQNTQKKIFIALLAAQAVILAIIESFFPPLLAAVPGAKLGLANMIMLIAIYTLPKKDSFLLLWLRLLVTTLLLGSASTFLYSAAGGLLSYGVMLLLKSFHERFSILGVSAAGGFMHNVGQLLLAAMIAQSWSLMLYLPWLGAAGLLAGLLTGFAANLLLERLPFLKRFWDIEKTD